MHSAILSLVLASALAQAATQPTGYGRFPCSAPAPTGTGFIADPSKCLAANIVAPGLATTNTEGNQGDGATPVDAQCVQQAGGRGFFCGIAGATCKSDANCDNGSCKNGICQGGMGQGCTYEENGQEIHDDSMCSGYLYCNNADLTVGGTTCGGPNSYCADYTLGSTADTMAELEQVFSPNCQSGYCNMQTLNCDTRVELGGDCTKDPEFACGTGLRCSTDGKCVSGLQASQNARMRRAAKRSLCSVGFSACPVTGTGGRGFECIDTAVNLEQCGACLENGGVDCTALPGVDAVGCVHGQCEIWSCSEGYKWDANDEACKPELRSV